MTLPPASSAPEPRRGTRSRAGNAMARTRAAVLDGAVRAAEKYGTRRATMGDIATLGGIAKATLYNHFRTKDDVWTAVLDAEVASLGAECVAVAAEEGLAPALARAAERLGAHPAVRRVASEEPAVLAALVRPGSGGAWPVARAQGAAVLAAAGLPAPAPAVDTVLRWLVTHLATPGSVEDNATGARVLSRGLTPPSADAGAVTAGSADTSS